MTAQHAHAVFLAKRAAERAALIENVEWLLGTDTPQSIARRVGSPSLAALTRRLDRAGRRDLAARFETKVAA